MSYYYSNPGGFSISKTVLPSITSSICQSAGLNSGGVVRESASVSTTSTAVGPYIQQLGSSSGGGGDGGSVTSITFTSGVYLNPPASLTITGGGGSGATCRFTTRGSGRSFFIDTITLVNGGSGYTSPPTITVSPFQGASTFILTISSGSGSSSTSFQQIVDNDPKLILLK
jgi:hypothetical protein